MGESCGKRVYFWFETTLTQLSPFVMASEFGLVLLLVLGILLESVLWSASPWSCCHRLVDLRMEKLKILDFLKTLQGCLPVPSILNDFHAAFVQPHTWVFFFTYYLFDVMLDFVGQNVLDYFR
jgi:hypothetical protein